MDEQLFIRWNVRLVGSRFQEYTSPHKEAQGKKSIFLKNIILSFTFLGSPSMRSIVTLIIYL